MPSLVNAIESRRVGAERRALLRVDIKHVPAAIEIEPQPAGGADLTARLAQKILQELKLVEAAGVVNKPGGGQTIAWAYLNQHAGDANYLSVVNEPIVTNRVIGASALDHNDFTPLALLFDEYMIFAVSRDSPITSGGELVRRLRTGAESVTFGFGSSRGNNAHIAVGLVGRAAGAPLQKMKTVVFNSGPAATAAVLGGHVDVVVTTPAAIREQVKAGLVRGLALTSKKRLAGEFADLPTWHEQGVDAVFSSWRLLFAPKGLSAEQAAYWVAAFEKVVATGEWKADLEVNARENHLLTGGALRKFLDAQQAQLGSILTDLGLAKR